MNILFALAVIPPILLLVMIWRIDKKEHEPWSLIIKVMFFGALSGIIAGLIESILDRPISLFFGNDYSTYLIVDNFIGVALVEEGVKMAVLMCIAWKSAEFDHLFDGVVYGASASLGFALLENVGYAFSYGFSTVIVRAFTAIPGHLIFGVMMGSAVAKAKEKRNKVPARSGSFWLIVAILIPVVLHGFYDYLLSVPFSSAEAIWFIYFIAVAVIAALIIKYMSLKDRAILRGYSYELPDEGESSSKNNAYDSIYANRYGNSYENPYISYDPFKK